MNKLDESYVGEFGTRLESQVSAQRSVQKAHDEGDADAMFEAQKNISRLALDEARYDQIKQRKKASRDCSAEAATSTAQPTAAPARPDPKAEAWAEKNNWFGTDQTMTYAAFGIHRQLIEDEGFDPASDEYYNELRSKNPWSFPQSLRNQSGIRDPESLLLSPRLLSRHQRGAEQSN